MKEIMNTQKEIDAMKAFHEGDRPKGLLLQDEFLQEFRELEKDHCSCRKACKLHGNCKECVAVHRAHRDHLPNCFRSMVNEKLKTLSSLTEHTVLDDGDENINK